MLTRLDETLRHQLPTTFDHGWTSDPRLFDRDWLGGRDHLWGVRMQVHPGTRIASKLEGVWTGGSTRASSSSTVSLEKSDLRQYLDARCPNLGGRTDMQAVRIETTIGEIGDSIISC